LTVESFDKLSEQLAASGAQTPHHVAILVREIFEKATQQHTFISMYADLCGRLEEDTRIVRAALTNSMQPDSFRRILLHQCQASFEEMLNGSLEWGMETCQDPDEMEALRARCKQKALGNVKLVGRLLVNGMLSSKLLITLCEDLVDSRESCRDALECLGAMLTVAGPTFDTEEWLMRSSLSAIFKQVKDLTADKSVSPRIRFLLRDVLELRAAAWRDKKLATTQVKGPMTLQEVRDEATSTPMQKAAPSSKWESATKWESAKTPRDSAKAQKESAKTPPSESGHHMSTSAAKVSASPLAKHVKVTAEPAIDKKEVSATARRRMQRKQSAARQAEAGRDAAGAAKGVGTEEVSAAGGSSTVVHCPSVTTTVTTVPSPFVYSRASFQQVMWQTPRDLKSDGIVQNATKRIEKSCVPVANQAEEFTDLITRAAEERSGEVRSSFFALAAALAAGAFRQSACLEGVENFFLDVFDELCTDVAGLTSIMAKEFVPALLQSGMTKAQLADVVPPDLRC